MYGLCRYLESVTLTYISRSIDFYTFYVALPYVFNYKTFNHQTLYSASSRCADSADTLTRWSWPIFCTPVTLTHFTFMFDISSNIRPTTTKPCIVLHLIVLAWQVPWLGDLDLYLTHFTLMFDNSSTIRPTTTISCIVLLHDVLSWQVPWPGNLDLHFMLQWLLHILHRRSISLGCIIWKVCAGDIAIIGDGTGWKYMCPTRHFVYIFFNPPTKHC